MGALYSPEWYSETAVLALLQPLVTYAQHFYTSDTTEKRQWPSLIVTCVSSEEMKIGRRATSAGGYQSGVFLQRLEVALEIKADLVATPKPTVAAAAWMQVYQAMHQNILLQTLITTFAVQPYTCFSATLEQAEETVDDERRIWRKMVPLQLRAMANVG